MVKTETISAEEFVRLWQTSESLQACADAAGLSMQQCRCRAGSYRKKGVPLRRWRTGSCGHKKIDWNALIQLALTLETKE